MTERAIASTAVWPLSLRLAPWVSAVLALAGLGLGTVMVQFVHNPALRFELTQTHKNIGIATLALTVLRLCRRLFGRAPKPEPAARSLLLAAKATHTALYALLVLLPASGWFMATTTPVRVPTVVFGLFALPYPMAPTLAIYRIAHNAHVMLAILLSVLIRVALFGRHGPRIGLARPDTCAHLEGPKLILPRKSFRRPWIDLLDLCGGEALHRAAPGS
jgi:cytochrome b561